jgi:hypothetical protein
LLDALEERNARPPNEVQTQSMSTLWKTGAAVETTLREFAARVLAATVRFDFNPWAASDVEETGQGEEEDSDKSSSEESDQDVTAKLLPMPVSTVQGRPLIRTFTGGSGQVGPAADDDDGEEFTLPPSRTKAPVPPSRGRPITRAADTRSVTRNVEAQAAAKIEKAAPTELSAKGEY